MKLSLICPFAVTLLFACNSNTPTQFERPDAEAFVACGVTETEYQRLMSLPQHDFDQDMDGGWRRIANQDNCKSVSGYLIEDYIENQSGSNILYWHAGQMHAYSGDTSRAKTFFIKAHNPDLPPDDHGYEWAIYAQGTIAFLDKDKAALQTAISKLAAIPIDPERIAAVKKMQESNPNMTFPKGFPEKPLNLIALEGLLTCFDAPYSQAYGNKCSASTAK